MVLGVWDPSIHPFLLTLPVCGGCAKCEAPLTALRTLGSNQEVTVVQSLLGTDGGRREVFVQPTGSRMVFCYPFGNLGEMLTELTGS